MKHLITIPIAAVALGLCNPAFAQTVALNEVSKPLRLVAKDIVAQTGSEITVDKNVAEQKLVCVVHGAPEAEVLEHVARVLGAQVTKKAGAKPSYTLALTPEVVAWSRAYARARDDAFRRAVADTADYLFAEIQKQLPKVPATTDAGQLSHLAPEKAWRLFASAYASGTEGLELMPVGKNPIYVQEFQSLSPSGQEAVRQALDKLTSPYTDALRKDPASTYVTVSSGRPPSMGISRRGTDGSISSGYSYSLPLDMNGALPERRKQQKFYLTQWLQKHPVPAASVLDFAVTAFDAPDPALRESGDLIPLPVVPALPGGATTRTELLTFLSKNPNMNVVADCYTDDTLLKQAGANTKDTLTQAGRTFGCVWERQGSYLLSRQVDWVEKDVTEAPYPLFEQAFASRLPKGDLTSTAVDALTPRPLVLPPTGDLLLPLPLFLQVCGLPHEQFKHLAFYRGKDSTPVFLELWALLDQLNSPTFEYRKYRFLNTVPIEKLTSAAGLLIVSCPQELLDGFNGNNYIISSNQYKPLPPDARVRLRHNPPPKSDDDHMEGWTLEILTGPNQQLLSIVENVPAAPPKPAPAPDGKPPKS